MMKATPARQVRLSSWGPWLWVLSLQYFVAQFVVAQVWYMPKFNLRYNTISDLGNTVCGMYGERLVCSPLHALMNGSFIMLGLTMAGGALLLRGQLGHNTGGKIGLTGLILAGAGTCLVGLFPENTVAALHVTGAALPFVLGNSALIVLGFSLKLPKTLKLYSLGLGIIGLVGLGLFVTHHTLGLGLGGMERVTAYPQTIWLITMGAYVLRQRTGS